MKKELINYSILFLILILYLVIGNYYNLYLPCLFHKITNLYCPGCGITRALKSLVSLNFYQAFRYNNLIILLPIFIIYYLELFLDKYKIKNLNLKRYMTNKFFIVILIIVVIYGILRNIPDFAYLIPTQI